MLKNNDLCSVLGEERFPKAVIYNWRASVVSETLTGVTQLKIGDVCLFRYMFGRMYVILYFDPPYFCVRSAFDPVPTSLNRILWFSDHYPYHLRN